LPGVQVHVDDGESSILSQQTAADEKSGEGYCGFHIFSFASFFSGLLRIEKNPAGTLVRNLRGLSGELTELTEGLLSALSVRRVSGNSRPASVPYSPTVAR